jgi:leader peptidase (prepilin peptidase)/N-methyltransferase
MIGGLAGIGLMVFGKKARGSAIPFGPYLVIGAMISLLFGDKIINWYMAYALATQ